MLVGGRGARSSGGVGASDGDGKPVGNVYYGTSSWTDPTLLKSKDFYPPDAKKPEERLRFYSEHFPLVEVDATFYALPSERNAGLWAERTPENFVFNVKAFGLMTQHAVAVKSLPEPIRDMLPEETAAKARVYARDLPEDALNAVWDMFASALRPLPRPASWARSCTSSRTGSRPAGRTSPTCASLPSARPRSPRSSSAAPAG